MSTIHLRDIQVTSFSNPHPDLPTATQIFAQLIVDGVIVDETMSVDSEDSADSLIWELRFEGEIPLAALEFSVAILRETHGPRLLGYAEIVPHDSVLSEEEQSPLRVPLVNVNTDGPSLQLSAAFSTSDLSSLEGNESVGIEIGPLDHEAIMTDLQQMLDHTNSEIELDPQALCLMHERILLLPTTNDERPSLLNFLGDICLQQWQAFNPVDVLHIAVGAFDDALRDNPADTTFLPDLGIVLLLRFEQLGDVEDITKCVSVMQRVILQTPDDDADKPSWLSNLGSSLVRRFQCLGEVGDLDKAITMGRDAMLLVRDSHPEKLAILNNLGTSLAARFKRLGDLADLNQSVLVGEDAVRLTPDGQPDKPARLSNLGEALLTRFKHLGDLDDLNKAVLMSEDAVRLTPDGHHGKSYWLINLGRCLFQRFTRLRDIDDLHKAITMEFDAVSMAEDDQHNKPLMLTNLGTSLCGRFECLGDLRDLNNAILMQEYAVRLTPDPDSHKASRLNQLCASLVTRFESLGDLGDLNKSVSIAEDAVRLSPDGSPDKPSRLNMLGMALLRRFERLGDMNDFKKSVVLREDAIRLTPDGHPSKASWLNNLGGSFLTRFESLVDLDDLNKAVSMLEDSVILTPDGYPNKPMILTNLSNSLLTRFRCLRDVDDFNQAVSVQEDAVRLTPDGHPNKPLLLNNLGNSLVTRFENLTDEVNLPKIILCYSSAARSATGPADVRFYAASTWAQCARIGKHPSLMDAYHAALDLLPEVAWLGLSITDRHHHLLKAGKLVRDAVATAIALGQAKKAVEWSEQGRSIIWGQLLNLRTPVDTLKNSHPELAKKLLFLSAELEGSGGRRSGIETPKFGNKESLQSIADQAHRNAYERGEVLKEIRELEGFSQFLLPRNFSDLSQAAQRGPVVILNISYSRSDALILRPGLKDEVLHISLTAFTAEHAAGLLQSFGDLVGRGERLVGRREGQRSMEDEFAYTLSELWVGVVRPVLNVLGITTATKNKFQRIWWCPTGPLAFLPIHAAGLFGKDDSFGSKLSDFAISSYAPSLTALIEGLRAPCKMQKPLKLLAVAQPSAVGQPYIPGTQREISRIQQLAAGTLPVLRLDGDMATVNNVQQGMRDSRWVHFACHGLQDVLQPTESALLLAGSSRLTLSSIIKLALPDADFAFLSACQTATGDKEFPEESVHLAAGMLLAGYRGVIATMWTIRDEDTPQLASDVYAHLFNTSPPDPTKAAEALHLAVRDFCEGSGRKRPFSHWVPFIHVGV
ncbi:CHAT domain-containing protein [Mycena vulgaris]|nr:CHAT domain-containing protein [Mycena vulgaris]